MEDGLILAQSEYARLLEEIHKLQARIAELTALRDDLVYHVCPALRAEYDEKIVSLERELMAANMYLRELQRTIEILQSRMNQQQEPSMEEARAQAKKENKEFEEDLNRKAEEARKFRKKWEESRWSKHDREEKEQKEKEEDQEEKAREEKEERTRETKKDKNRGEDKEDSGPGKEDKKGSAGSGDQDDETGETGRPHRKETVADKIKRLYRKIVKRLHPDVHPNLTEHEKELWNRAVKAQQEGDLEALERIWDDLSGMDAPEDAFDDTPEGRAKLKELLEKLKIRLRLLELEIDHIKTEFPYKIKTFLEDPVAVEEVRRGILSKIDNVREMNRQLEDFIRELKEKLRNGEKL